MNYNLGVNITITKKQKKILERQLKEVNMSYGIGIGVAILMGVIIFVLLRMVSRFSLLGFETYIGGFWTFVWVILISLMIFLKWISGNRLSERKREIELKLAEEVVG